MTFRFPTRAVLAMLALACVCFPLMAQKHVKGDPKRMVREQIEALEEQWRLAQLSADIPAMDKLLADDYLGVTINGDVVTKAQQLDRLRTRVFNLTQLDISDIKIKLIGQIAIVNSRAEIVGRGENAPVDGSYRYTRVYQRGANGAWRITSFEATRIAPAGRRPRTDAEAAPASPPRP